ncbi:unnamed protein product [Closterium sp. NIES-64]|nr:unnamed protein product [Closterium sp. NIES-64]
MASAIRVRLLAPLAVGLLATAASAARGVMGGARGMAPGEADSSDGSSSAGGAGQQRKGVRILATDTFAHHAPLPGYLDHIPRRQALATSTRCCSPSLLLYPNWSLCAAAPLPPTAVNAFPLPLISLLPVPLTSLLHFPPCPPHPLSHPAFFLPVTQCPTVTTRFLNFLFFPSSPTFPLPPLSMRAHDACGSTKAMIRSQYLGPYDLHNLTSLLPPSHPLSLPQSPSLQPCGRKTVTIRSQYVGPYDLHNDIYNMTFYNGCAYNVTSPLRVWQCFNFGNVWEGSLDNPDPNPSQYQTGDIFVQSSPGYCEMHMNRGVSGTLQMLPGETVNIVYAWTGDFRPCAQELRFSNGNSYSMTNTTDCQIAAVI